eukprot:365802-Chlamydomonas_euryale.AAC.15
MNSPNTCGCEAAHLPAPTTNQDLGNQRPAAPAGLPAGKAGHQAQTAERGSGIGGGRERGWQGGALAKRGCEAKAAQRAEGERGVGGGRHQPGGVARQRGQNERSRVSGGGEGSSDSYWWLIPSLVPAGF